MARSRLSDGILVMLSLLLGVFACLGVQAACLGIVTESDGRPEPNTPRAAFCAPVDHWYRWLVIPLGAVLIGLAFSRLLGRLRHARAWSAAAVALLAVAAVVVSSQLRPINPI